MTEAYKKLMRMGEEYLVIVDALLSHLNDLEKVSNEMETYLDSQEYMSIEQPQHELNAQIELAQVMASQFTKFYNKVVEK